MCPPSRLCHLKVRDKRYRRFKPAVVAPTPKTASAAPAAIRSHGWPPAAASPVPVLGGFTPPACVPPVDVFVGAGGAGGFVAGTSVGPSVGSAVGVCVLGLPAVGLGGMA